MTADIFSFNSAGPCSLEQLSDINEEFNRIAGIGSGASPEEMQAASRRLGAAYKAWRLERFADKFEPAAD